MTHGLPALVLLATVQLLGGHASHAARGDDCSQGPCEIDRMAFTRAVSPGYLRLVNWDSGTLCSEVSTTSVPAGIAYGQNRNLFVWVQNSGPLLEFSPEGMLVGTVVAAGAGGSLQGRGIAQMPNGDWLVAGGTSQRVARFDGATGEFVGDFVSAGDGGLGWAWGLAFAPNGNLLVTSASTNAVLEYDGTTGSFVRVFADAKAGGLATPYGLTIGPDGNVYVTGRDDGYIYVYDGLDGTFIEILNGVAVPSARGIRFGPNGNLFVCSWQGPLGGGVYEFEPESGGLVRLAASANAPMFVDFPRPNNGDFNGDGSVDGADLSVILGFWGQSPTLFPPADLNCDGLIDGTDLGILLGNWGLVGF